MVPRLEGLLGFMHCYTYCVILLLYTFCPKLCKSSFPWLFSHARETGGSFGTSFRIPNTECCQEDLLGQVSLLTTFAHILVRCQLDGKRSVDLSFVLTSHWGTFCQWQIPCILPGGALFPVLQWPGRSETYEITSRITQIPVASSPQSF